MVKTNKSYLDIKATVLARIRDNTWAPNTIIPGEIDLAQEFGCARATVNRAMRDLVEEGILDRKRKAGTRVKSSPTRQVKFTIPLVREEIQNMGAQYRYSLVKREKQMAPDWLCARLALPRHAPVIHLECVHFANNRPFQYEDRWINLAAVPAAEHCDFKMLGPNEWLVNQVPFTDVELTFSAGEANDEVAKLLAVVKAAALFTVERTTWLEMVPVTYARLCFGAGYQMTTKL